MTAITTFTGTVIKKGQLASDTIMLSMKVPAEFTFKAGQFVTIKIDNNGQRKLKSYSILSPPSQKGQLDFCIKIIDNGFASVIFTKTKIGDQFELKGPFGFFVFDENSKNKEHYFIGAGTGLAPLYSIITEQLPLHPGKKFTLLFGTKTQQTLLLHQELQQLAATYPYFTYVPTLSREKWSGKMGRVQEHLAKSLKNKTFYICGLKELVLETKELLIKKGVDLKNIKYERYS